MAILTTMGTISVRYSGLFLKGLGYTLLLSAIAVFFGVLIGSLFALMKMNKGENAISKLMRFIAAAYVEIIRGTPLLLQLYFFYFLLPELVPQLELGKFACISIALCLNSAGYVAEIIRAGIEAVDHGQSEAARSIGLTTSQTMRYVVLPQAVKNILPALCNEFVSVIKETSLASTFFIGDLMSQYKTISGALFLTIEPLIIVGIIYFMLTFSLSKGITLLEKRLKISG